MLFDFIFNAYKYLGVIANTQTNTIRLQRATIKENCKRIKHSFQDKRRPKRVDFNYYNKVCICTIGKGRGRGRGGGRGSSKGLEL